MFLGRQVLQVFSWFCPFLAGVSAQCCSVVERVALYGFQLLFARWCVLLVDVDGGWAHAFCLFSVGLDCYCVYWLVVIVSRGAKRCLARVFCPVLSYVFFVLVVHVHVLFYGFSGMWMRAHIM